MINKVELIDLVCDPHSVKALISDDTQMTLFTAENHSGDSDSTGAICGNILGASLGIEGIPSEWISKVELSDVITDIANNLLKLKN